MTKQEWYESPDWLKLRLLNNIAAEIQQKTQHFNDILRLILAEKIELMCHDKFGLCERQSRIVSLEASKMWDYARKLDSLFEPRQYDDICKRCHNPWNEDGTCRICPNERRPLAVPKES